MVTPSYFNTSSVAVNTSLFINPGYNLEKDFVGVANVASTLQIFLWQVQVCRKKLLKEAIEGAKSGKYNYASPGEGTTPHLSAEYLFPGFSESASNAHTL
jgi:tripartite-type tricarboxylate transporter receptor subunit TctC